MSPQSLLSRLESLQRHLGEEGWHVHSNTVWLAMEELQKRRVGRPKSITDMKVYKAAKQREYRARKRAETLSPSSQAKPK